MHDMVGNDALEVIEGVLEESQERVHEVNALGQGVFHSAVLYKRMDLMPVLLAEGADVNVQDQTGLTALHVCGMYGRREAAAWLVEHGADLSLKDSFGDSALHTAAVFGQGGVVKVLVDAGMDLEAVNGAGKTPLELARHYERERAAKYIEKLLAGG